MRNIFTSDYYQVCRTGKTRQYYTLYVERAKTTEFFSMSSCQYIQNLGYDFDESMEKAQAYKDSRDKIFQESWGGSDGSSYRSDIDFFESPRNEYCDLEAFGLEWSKTAKGFKANYISDEVWELWRGKKSTLKKFGFSVFKNSRTDEFIFFFKNRSDEELARDLKDMKEEMETQEITGEYPGEIGDRIEKEVTVNVIKKGVAHFSYGTGTVTFTLEMADSDGNPYRAFYSGKYQFEDGEQVILKGTIKKLEIRDYKRSTTLTRLAVQ